MNSWIKNSRGSFLLHPVFASLALLVAGGCMRSPHLDAKAMTCKTDDNCLIGYVCGAGYCRKPGDGLTQDAELDPLPTGVDSGSGLSHSDTNTWDGNDAGTADAIDAPASLDANNRTDGSIVPVDGSVAGTGGNIAATGGAMAATGGTVVSTGGTIVSTGGTVVATGGAVVSTGGTIVATGGTTTVPPVTCPKLSTPVDGTLDVPLFTVGAVATYSCATGYTMQGSAKRTCQADGTWTGTDPTCSPVDCGPLPKIENGIVSALYTTYTKTATYQCSSGMYTLVGKDTRACQANGTWSDSAPVCQCIAACGGTCVDLAFDTNNCGACGNVCTTTAPSVALDCNQRCIIELVPAKDRPVPPSLVVDATWVYWTDWVENAVKKTPIAGGPSVVVASDQDRPRGIAIDANSIYWINFGTSTLMRMPISGGTPTLLSPDESTGGSIVLDDTNLYWPATTDGKIKSIPKAGGTVTTLASNQALPQGLALYGSTLFWTNSGTSTNTFHDGSIVMMPVQGGTPTALATGRTSPADIAVNATYVYWTEWTDNGSVMRLPRTGGTPELISGATGNNLPHNLAIDSLNVYWTASDAVNKTPLGGGQTVRITGSGNPGKIVVDAKAIYWGTMGVATPTIGRASPK